METKIIIRTWLNGYEVVQGQARFVNTGIWGDGHLAYSMVDENNNVIEEYDGVFAQIRKDGKLMMLHI